MKDLVADGAHAPAKYDEPLETFVRARAQAIHGVSVLKQMSTNEVGASKLARHNIVRRAIRILDGIEPPVAVITKRKS